MKNNKLDWPLMKNCITDADKTSLVNFINNTDRYTNGIKVKELEQNWSDWLGVKYSLFVSSGSTANLLLLSSIKSKYDLKSGDKVIVPAITWSTNISPVIQLGFTPIFCDVDVDNFGFDLKHFKELCEEHKDIKMVFVTHLFGVPAPIQKYKDILDVIYLEDCCESHGATINNDKVGTFSEGSTFSSYFGHHLTTIEGGFVSTDDDELYEIMRAKRSHGLARECSLNVYNNYVEKYPDVDKRFLFITDGYNFRNNELSAVLGISQLKRLDDMILRRRTICHKFETLLQNYSDVFHIPDFSGNSSFCLPFILNNMDLKNNLQTFLEENGVETRPLCSGNLLRQPFLKDYVNKQFKNADKLHFNGFYIGNNHLVSDREFGILEILIKQWIYDKGLK